MGLDLTSVKSTVLEGWRSLYFVIGNRRQFERNPLSGEVIAIHGSNYAESARFRCSCVDWSPRGIAVTCPEALPRDASVRIQSDSPRFTRFARVRYCQHDMTAFRIGFEFLADPELEK